MNITKEKYRDESLKFIEKFFSSNRNPSIDVGQPTAESLSFYCAMKIAHSQCPDSFVSMCRRIDSNEAVNYFHKSFRQTDVFEIPGLDSLIYNIIDLFKESEWIRFEYWTKYLIVANKSIEEFDLE